MLKIGEFSKLSMLTVKALRFYEKEGLLEPASVDAWTGYRLYETVQLQLAARIKAYRQLGLSVAQTREILDGADEKPILSEHARKLREQQDQISTSLSIIENLLKGNDMDYQVTVKAIPAAIGKRIRKGTGALRWLIQLSTICRQLIG